MREAQKEYHWTLNFGSIAQIWRGGCIIRAVFLQKITEAYGRNPELANLLLDPYFNKTVKKAQANWRKVVALAAQHGIPAPTFSSALSYYDGYRAARLPANLLQAQRDYFGATPTSASTSPAASSSISTGLMRPALEKVRGLRSTGLSPAIIFDLHRCVTEGTLDTVDASGRLRREGEISALRGPAASEHEFPPAAELGRRLESMCAFANGETPAFFVHPVVRAVLLHFWLAYEHPFVDGNGRAARILFHWAALRQGYPVFAYLAISPVLMQDPASYMLAFRHTETDDNDLTYFLLHQAAAIQTAMAAFFDRTTRIACERNATKAGLPGFAALNSRQQALIAHAIRRPEARYGIVGHQRSHGITHQTARDDLFDLTRRELLTVGKEGRTYFFQAAADLPRKLQSAVGRRRAAAVVLSGELPTNLL
jgi:Fic family protein